MPIGAELQPGEAYISASGRGAEIGHARRRRRRNAMQAEKDVSRRYIAARIALRYRIDGGSACCPIASRAQPRSARPALSRSSAYLDGFPGRRPTRGPGHLRDACRHLHARGHLDGCHRQTAAVEGDRHRGNRDNAGRGISRPVRLGL
jgi:hypothetical protein